MFPLYPYFNVRTCSAFLQVPPDLCQVAKEILLISVTHSVRTPPKNHLYSLFPCPLEGQGLHFLTLLS